MLRGCHIALGITGSIAAYKAADIASKLTQAGAQVDALMTEAATRFVTPLTLRSLTGRPVFLDMFDPNAEMAEEHVEIARRADAVLVAPASATTIARLAEGIADDVVSLTVLATNAPVLLAPAMDNQMFENASTQANLETLRERGYVIVGPAEGRLASGHAGKGRLVDAETLVGAVAHELGRRGGALAGRRVVVTAGGTREPLDPVRFISNYSTGKMGYAIAEAARDRGAEVTLVSTASLAVPYGVALVPVETVAQMREAVLDACRSADALVMAAAVSDYRPAEVHDRKVKKSADTKSIALERNADFLLEITGPVIKVGFAAETNDLIENAEKKLREKGLAFIVANDVTSPGSGFGTDTNEVTIIDAAGREQLPLLSKYEVGERILDRIASLIARRAPAR